MSFAARSFWSRLAATLESGRRVMLAVVAESSVHSPGTAGAKMYVADDGERMGTIGGGVMELRVLERAKELFGAGTDVGTGRPWAERAEMVHRKSLDQEDVRDEALKDEAVAKSGMICAGRQTNLYVLLGPGEALGTVQEILSALEDGFGAWNLDSSGRFWFAESPLNPLCPGRNSVAADSAGEDWPRASQQRTLHRQDDAWRYSESLLERRRVAILGGGHCGRALARLMAGMGWHVSMWETRSEVLYDEGQGDGAARFQVQDFRNAAPAIDFPELTPVVVMTTDVPNDVRALFGVLSDDRGFPFVGAMGSAAKLDEIRRRLTDLGVSREALARITAPVGLEVDSHTPAEIAVSVAAQLLQLRHRWLS